MVNKNISDEFFLREKIVKKAIEQYGKPYIHGNHGPNSFDCAGFVWYVFNDVLDIDIYSNGIGLSTTTKIMTSSIGKLVLYDEFSLEKDISLIRKGDVVLFHRQSKNEFEPKENNKYPGHCGIFLGDGRFIHCSYRKGKVIISNFDKNEYWERVLVASKDVTLSSKILFKN